ncbi:MAG TPA: hypothetical protein DDY13_14555 [Cytophagales bacterium]|jgi:hypothetical protein|nr:hypothetical protein [Cytophagales bacterium]
MAYLDFISDKDLLSSVRHVLQLAREAQQKAEKEFHKNVIDPFSAMFEISGFQIDYTKWLISEKSRKSQKTLQNHIGDFHQIILGNVEGWENLKVGEQVDVICSKKKY